MEGGETVAAFKSPQHPYTWSLLETLPRLEARRGRLLPKIRGMPQDLMDLTGHCSFLERCPKGLTMCREEPEPPLELINDGDGSGILHRISCFNPVEQTPA